MTVHGRKEFISGGHTQHTFINLFLQITYTSEAFEAGLFPHVLYADAPSALLSALKL